MAGPRPHEWPHVTGVAAPCPQLHQGPPWVRGPHPPPASVGETGAQGTLVDSGQSFPVTRAKGDLTWASHSRACKIFLRSQRLRAVTMATWPCTHSSFCVEGEWFVGGSTGPRPGDRSQQARAKLPALGRHSGRLRSCLPRPARTPHRRTGGPPTGARSLHAVCTWGSKRTAEERQ